MLERMEKQNRIFSGFDADAIDRTTAADLAEVGSDKWTRYPGCIGAFIAEMDYGLAPCIQQAIDSACDHCKLGYIPEPWKRRVAEACAGWQKSHYGWDVDPDIIRVVPDVLEAYEIFLRELVGAGNAVVVPTPAYMPFLSVPKLYDVDVIEIEMLQGTDETTGEREWLFDFDVHRTRVRGWLPCVRAVQSAQSDRQGAYVGRGAAAVRAGGTVRRAYFQ